jgi:crotonobetainyl-CoA:carnitine CoA-transferase CaiB-like acyl-CoA transferase
MTIFSAFDGVRILDLTVNLAGPYSTQILADLGADVIKVERPGTGDDTRNFYPKAGEESVVFASVNRNKRSIVLDLKEPAGRDVALRLGATCDVVVESFRPGKADALGLGFEAFRALNDAVIYCSVSAFGRGPAGAELPGYDPLLQAFCGIMSTTGHPGDAPTRVAASLVDLSTGMWAALGISAALAERARTGEGQVVEATLVDTAYALMCHQITGYLATGEIPGQHGSGSPIAAPYEAFRTSDGWVMIAAANNTLFARLCAALDLQSVAEDVRFRDPHGRTTNRSELHTLLEERILSLNREDVISKVRGAGVPIGPVNRVDQAVTEAIVDERHILIEPDGASSGDMRLVRLPLTAEGDFEHRAAASPSLGEHSEEILNELADLEGRRDVENAGAR